VDGMREDERIGARIATERKLRGLTQQQLADRARVSLSLLRKVEQGSRPPTTALVSSVAAALGVERTKLTGQPYFSGSRKRDAIHELVPELRREMSLYGLAPDTDETTSTLALGELAARVAECSELVHSVQYFRLGTVLPGLLADLRQACFTMAGRQRARAMWMTAETYDNAKRFACDLGYTDIGALAVNLEERAAMESDDTLAVAVSRAVRAWSLTGIGAFDAAHNYVIDAIDDLEPELRAPRQQTWSVWGFLNLQAALSCARNGDAARTWEHHAHALHASAQLDGDRDDYRLAFGPTNTAIWGVGLAVELQDGPAAVARGEHVMISPDLPRARAGHHYMDLARGHLYNADYAAALGAMLTARRIAPQQVRYNPSARETVYSLARAERRASDTLRGLAAWMGVER
jgi:transcriptional regulator with XRE-family HTH domain